MGLMVELVRNFKEKKFKKCLDLIKSIQESSEIIEDFSLENCKLVCESIIIRRENNFDKIYDMQEQHYLFLEKVTSVETFSKSLPIQLKLIATFNFIFWLTFYNKIELDLFEAEEYLQLVNKGLVIVLGGHIASEKTCNMPEKILSNLTHFKDLILTEDSKTALLIIELIIIILMFFVNVKKVLVKDSLEIVSFFISELKHKVNSTSAEEFSQVNLVKMSLFKFSMFRTATLLSDIDSEAMDCLNLLESVFLLLLNDFRGSLKSLQKSVTSDVKNVWNYLVVFNSFETENWNLCLGFLTKTPEVIQNDLKARFHIMQGKLNSIERNHKEALKEFVRASALSPNCPTTYYYIGQEYARIGLVDLMVENFEKLVQVLSLQVSETDSQSSFESTLLQWIHPKEEITESEAYYALAVSHLLNENFKSAAENFEKVFQFLDGQILGKKKRIVETPSFLIVLHEAAVTNLLLGNLLRAEQIALDAVSQYLPQKSLEEPKHHITLSCKDTKWLQRAIQQELLEVDFDSFKLLNETAFSEDLIFFFSENVVALLILCEVQRIQESEDYNATLNKVFSIFSEYLALMHKKEKINEDEKHALTLVKALAGKTCIKIADILTTQGEVTCVEKMLKRALSCNKGDKDALYKYYQLLMNIGKEKEALKLWNTFFKEKKTIEIDLIQSFSLRYFLIEKITVRELESIQKKIDYKNANLF